MQKSLVNFVRRLVGFGEVNERFDQIHTNQEQFKSELSEQLESIRNEYNKRIDAFEKKLDDSQKEFEQNFQSPVQYDDEEINSLSQKLDQMLQTDEEIKNFISGEFKSDVERIIHQVNYTNHNLYLHLAEAMRLRQMYYRDMLLILDKQANLFPKTEISYYAEKTIATDTDDHLKPWGTAQDNTRSPRFVTACENRFERPLTFLDLGCSGGGLVLDFILRGHRGFGIEGSDYSLKAQRAEWRILKSNLFTEDITRPFSLNENTDDTPILCDVITMWEVMEHIADEDLPQLFENIKKHLKPDGIFVGSVALMSDDLDGASYHRTVKPRDWWENRFRELGLPMTDNHDFAFGDFCRGTNNGPIDENYMENPEIGFHYVATLA